MFWWIFNALLSSYALIIWKKSLELNILKDNLFMFLWMLWWLILSIIFILFWFTSFPWDYYMAIIGLIIVTCISVVMWFLSQIIFRNEKISVLSAFSNIDKIILIIVSFFLFKNTSIIAFWMALLATFILTLFAIDFSNFRLPKNFLLILLNNILSATKILIIWWLFTKHINSITYYSYNTIFYTFILVIPIIKAKQFWELRNGSREFYKYRIWAAIFWQIAAIIAFFLLETQGIIVSNLLWFLALWATLIFSYVFLWDKPSKKNILSAVIIFILVSVGYYFKDYWLK